MRITEKHKARFSRKTPTLHVLSAQCDGSRIGRQWKRKCNFTRSRSLPGFRLFRTTDCKPSRCWLSSQGSLASGRLPTRSGSASCSSNAPSPHVVSKFFKNNPKIMIIYFGSTATDGAAFLGWTRQSKNRPRTRSVEFCRRCSMFRYEHKILRRYWGYRESTRGQNDKSLRTLLLVPDQNCIIVEIRLSGEARTTQTFNHVYRVPVRVISRPTEEMGRVYNRSLRIKVVHSDAAYKQTAALSIMACFQLLHWLSNFFCNLTIIITKYYYSHYFLYYSS